ncbi:hypothetical protein BGZ68_003616, partial [Mortierella alpina]
LIFNSETKTYYVYYRWGETDYKLDGPHETIEAAKDAFQVTYKEKFDVEWTERETTTSEKWVYETKTYETFEEIEEVEEIVEETEAEITIAREKAAGAEGTTIHGETRTTVTEEIETVEHETKEETIIVEANIELEEIEAEEHAEEAVPEQVEKDVIAVNQVDIDPDVEAGVVDVEKVQFHVEVDAEVVDDDKVKEVVVAEVAVAPSPSLPECNISGIPASLGDLTTESLLSEMSASPVFDDQSLGAMDLEEEPDILQFLVDRVHEDPDFTKLLLWTVYKSGAEGIVNQSTKNAKCILELAGIRFLLQV